MRKRLLDISATRRAWKNSESALRNLSFRVGWRGPRHPTGNVSARNRPDWAALEKFLAFGDPEHRKNLVLRNNIPE
jgi:hypothetical protein